MHRVRIAAVSTASPPDRVSQPDAAALIAVRSDSPRRVAAIARGTRIDSRAIAAPVVTLAALGGIQERNDLYQRVAPGLAIEALRGVMPCMPISGETCLVTSSCTGYTIPGWGVTAVERLPLPCTTVRVPLTEAGCAGGVVALARAADFVGAHGGTAFATAVELCSLSFQAGGTDGNLTSTLIFGDGAGAARLESGEGDGLEILDATTMLVPGTQGALGFDLTGSGFYPVLRRDLVEILPPAVEDAVARLLARNGLTCTGVDDWLIHPGGALILSRLERALCLSRTQTHWSWESLRECGNTSSAAVFDVLRRWWPSCTPGRTVIVAAFGPGVSIELLLARAC